MPGSNNNKKGTANASGSLEDLHYTITSGFDIPSEKPEKLTEDILKEFQSWDEANTALWNNCNNGKPPTFLSKLSTDVYKPFLTLYRQLINSEKPSNREGNALSVESTLIMFRLTWICTSIPNN